VSTETGWTSVTDVLAPSMVRRNSGVSPPVTSDMKHTVGCDLICLYLIKQEDSCPKSVRLTNVVTVVSKLVNLVVSKGTDNLQFEDFSTDLKSGYRAVVYYIRVRC
jgi:hypothetical protein